MKISASMTGPNGHRTAQSTIDAFLWLGRYGEEPRLKKFLDEHPYDRALLIQTWEAKCAAPTKR